MNLPFVKPYPYKVRVWQVRGETRVPIDDMGRRVELKDGTVKLRLKNFKKDLPFPEGKYISAGKTPSIEFYQITEGDFRPVEIIDDNGTFKKKPVDKDDLLWFINQWEKQRQKWEREKSALDKILPVLMLGLVVGGYVFTMIIGQQTAVQIASIEERLVNDQGALWDKVGTILSQADAVINSKTIIANGGGAVAKPPI